jgi:hypothetical protein
MEQNWHAHATFIKKQDVQIAVDEDATVAA